MVDGVSGKVKPTGSAILKVLGKLFPHALKATTVNVPPVAPGPAVTVKLVPEAIPEKPVPDRVQVYPNASGRGATDTSLGILTQIPFSRVEKIGFEGTVPNPGRAKETGSLEFPQPFATTCRLHGLAIVAPEVTDTEFEVV
jgi:hypothetical protein